MERVWKVFAFALVAVIFSAGIGLAAGNQVKTYVYIDENGNPHYSATKLDERYRPYTVWHNKAFIRDFHAGKYDHFIRKMGSRYGIDPALIKAVIRAESDWNHKAVSRAGAQGLMQLMPGTARQLSVTDPFDPHQNIEAGVRYLRMMLDTFDGDIMLALAAYNAGPGAVKKYNGIPPYRETRNYVKRVLRYYREYLKS